MFGIDVHIDEAEFEREALKHIRAEAYSRLLTVAGKVRPFVQEAIDRAVRSSPEYDSLLSGFLREQFGIADPGPALEEIVAAVKNGVQVTAAQGSGDVLGSLTVAALREGMTDVLGLPGGSYISRSVLRNTEVLVPWLSWLLLEGDKVILLEWQVNTEKARRASRTGRAIMIRPNRRQSRGFRVPPQFSGTVDQNWLTRCLAAAAPAIGEAVARAVEAA